jgi:hypothetical protein
MFPFSSLKGRRHEFRSSAAMAEAACFEAALPAVEGVSLNATCDLVPANVRRSLGPEVQTEA